MKNSFNAKLEINKIHNVDCLQGLRRLPSDSIDCCVTSPPYWALRDYGVDGQLGLEQTFEEYVIQLCNIFDEIKRVLKNGGTCWVNLGDTYSGSCQGAGKKTKERIESKKVENLGSSQNYLKKYGHALTQKPPSAKTSVPSKSLCMIPFRFAIEMVNRVWILRNNIIWHKPNCMPSSSKDRFTVDFEYLFFFAKNNKYYFEQQFEEFKSNIYDRARMAKARTEYGGKWAQDSGGAIKQQRAFVAGYSIGRNKRSVWTICTKPSREAHFAVYPERLIETPIKAGCPRGGIVLDPFMGSGTTAVVAKKHHRNFIGFELNPEYCKIANKKIANAR